MARKGHPRRKLYGAALKAWRKARGLFKRSKPRRKKARARKAKRGHGRNPMHTGAFPMPTALVVNPGRSMRKRPRKAKNVLVNPRRRRRAHNPGGGIMAQVKEIGALSLPAIGGGLAIGFIDTKFLADKSAIVRTGGKVAVAVALGMFGRRVMGERAVTAAMGAVLGTVGYDIGRNLASGKGPLGDEGEEVEEMIPAGENQAVDDVYLGVLETGD